MSIRDLRITLAFIRDQEQVLKELEDCRVLTTAARAILRDAARAEIRRLNAVIEQG